MRHQLVELGRNLRAGARVAFLMPVRKLDFRIGLPEIVTWSEAPPDTLFETCTSCPKRVIERIFAERKYEGFSLQDSRMVQTPYAGFMLFVHLLIQHNSAAAGRLLYPVVTKAHDRNQGKEENGDAASPGCLSSGECSPGLRNAFRFTPGL